MANTDLIPIGITATTTFTPVSTLLNSAGLTSILNAPVTSSPGYILNRSSGVNLYVGYGTDTAPTAYAALTPLTALKFNSGMNTTLLWIASASSTVACDFVEGGDYQAVTISGVIGIITLSANEIPKGDGSGNLVASLLTSGTGKVYPTTDDGAALGDTTHNFSDLFLATGAVINYANSNVVLTHTSGIITMGTGELRITSPGTNAASVPTLGSTSTLTNKTFVAPVLGAATGTSLAVTGLLTTSSPTAAFGFATGAGGAVSQSTDKSTTVVSNTNTTAITTNAAQLNAATIVSFTFTNSAIASTDQLICTHQSGGTSGAYTINAFPGTGSAVISVRNNTAGNLSEAIVIRVSILKAVSA